MRTLQQDLFGHSPAMPTTNLPQSFDKALNKTANADALMKAIQPFSALPATNLRHIMGETPNEATNADALIGSIQPFPALPARNSAYAMGETPIEATNADASVGTIQPFPARPATNLRHIIDKDPVRRELSASLETHFNELCPINLLGSKCKCDLLKVNRRVSPSSIVERINTADCE